VTLEKIAGALEAPLYQLFYEGDGTAQIANLLKRQTILFGAVRVSKRRTSANL